MTMFDLYRQRHGLTQEAIGRQLGVTKQLVSAWARGTVPIDPRHHEKLKELLELSDAEMLNVITNTDIRKSAEDRYENLEPEYLKKLYDRLRIRKEQASSKDEKALIDSELAKLDRVSRHVANSINRDDSDSKSDSGPFAQPDSPIAITLVDALERIISGGALGLSPIQKYHCEILLAIYKLDIDNNVKNKIVNAINEIKIPEETNR